MTDQGEVIPGGVSEEVWQKLDQEWGTTAQNFRKLNFLRDYHGGYKHICHENIPQHILKRGAFVCDNIKINILEIRYGSIEGQNSGKPCLWFLLKHGQDPDGQMSTLAQLLIWFDIYEMKGKNPSTWVSIAENCPVTVFEETCQHGVDRYILAAKVFEPNEWPVIETKLSGESARGEPFSVHIYNSQKQIEYTPGGIWLVENIDF